MRMIREVGLKLLELTASVLATWSFDKIFPDAGAGVAWVVGAIVFLITQMFEILVRTGLHYEKHQASLSDMALEHKKTLSDIASKHQAVLSEIASTLASDREAEALLLTALSYSGRTLSRDEVREAWRKLSWHTQHTYSATNYICPADFYDTGHARNVLQLQKAKLRTHPEFKLRKIFIWKDNQERDSPAAVSIRDLHSDDDKIRMELWQMLHSSIEDNGDLKGFAAVHLGGMIDFATFDGRVACVWRLSQDRKVEDGRVIVGIESVKKFNDFFNMLTCENETQRL